jgi:hypothetical protein
MLYILHMLAVICMMCNTVVMRSYQSGDARRKMRDILTAVEHGEHVQIERYDTPTAVVVSPQWFKRALACLGEPEPHFEPDGEQGEPS